MKKTFLAIAVPLVFFGTAAYAGGDVEAGKAIYDEVCSDCHYEDDFAGTSQDDIKGMIKAIIAGEHDHGADISDLSDEDIANIAAYYASFE